MFSASRPILGVTEIADALQLNKGTVWGIITTLEACGMLRQDPATKKYQLGPKVYDLGLVFSNSLPVNRLAAESAQRLADQSNLTVWMGIWDGESILVTINALPKARGKTAAQIGPKLGAHCSAVGKAALAWLPPDDLNSFLDRNELSAFTPATITDRQELIKDLEETRQRGFSVSRQEAVIGQSGLAAPIFDARGELAAVIGIAGRSSKVIGDRLEELAEMMLAVANEISEHLGYYPKPLSDSR
jgi:DNA-binding IclR family transcriptional regulator